MAIDGVIASRVQALLPVTWDALLNDSRAGETSLQSAIDTAKYSVTGTLVAPLAEAAYPLTVIDYIAKIVALSLIPTGVDFWMNEATSLTTTGTAESVTYTDRANALLELRKILLEETRQAAPEIAVLVDYQTKLRSVPLSNTLNDDLLTPDPRDFPRPYAKNPLRS